MPRSHLSAADVVDAAAALADDVGFDAVSFSAVARSLGVRAPSLYSHVRDLAALRDALAESALRDLSERISHAIAGRSGASALRGLANAHRALATESPGRWQALQRRVGASVVGSGAARAVVELTSAVLRGYALPEREHVHAIRLIGSAINGFITLESSGGFDHSDPAPDASWERALDALDSLLCAWPAGADDNTGTKGEHQ
ncbi:hypothetical protein B1813_05075 [Saccharomonospora piscinae]|uniref:HTH tetR-type domain-containing protein n=1 Tax=Saccharomonospora piscinae TaxID=687388 RepID=A0A1V9A9Z5_SACPI|nr:TetR/AcrR family transcriptional regulator [Saccharomonospora piscinae]OQO93890.1 hypothetical protein B1813_05075 [Saccharomonospora piscinae]TLW95060.1 TetR family transcriptional regulator [Saccharomonospora piscinae]